MATPTSLVINLNTQLNDLFIAYNQLVQANNQVANGAVLSSGLATLLTDLNALQATVNAALVNPVYNNIANQ